MATREDSDMIGRLSRLWNAPRPWRYAAIAAIVFAFGGAGAVSASQLAATQIVGPPSSTSTSSNTAHVDTSGGLQVGTQAGILCQEDDTILSLQFASPCSNLTKLLSFKEVTYYVSADSVVDCTFETFPASSQPPEGFFTITLATESNVMSFVKTFDPAPINLQVQCRNGTDSDQHFQVVVVGHST